MNMERLCRLSAIAFAAALQSAAPIHAEEWPTRPVTMLVPFAAGGAFDVMGRIFTPRLGVGTHAFNATLYKKLPYHPATDFAPVALFAEQPMALVAQKDFPAGNLKDFIAYAKANAAKLQYGSAGVGSTTHLACALLNAAIGLNVTHVPYRGGGPAMADLIAGQTHYMCSNVANSLPQITGKTIKAIALLARSRSPLLPSLATANEQGLADFEAITWNAFFMPKGTPAAIVNKLNDAVIAAMESSAVKDRMQELGVGLVAPERRSPQYLQTFVESEIAKWAGPIKAAGVSMD
jgi:tripartite-type tricarboxylate transporter receptor subunit TctC